MPKKKKGKGTPRKSALLRDCPVCFESINARGWRGHLQFAHGITDITNLITKTTPMKYQLVKVTYEGNPYHVLSFDEPLPTAEEKEMYAATAMRFDAVPVDADFRNSLCDINLRPALFAFPGSSRPSNQHLTAIFDKGPSGFVDLSKKEEPVQDVSTPGLASAIEGGTVAQAAADETAASPLDPAPVDEDEEISEPASGLLKQIHFPMELVSEEPPLKAAQDNSFIEPQEEKQIESAPVAASEPITPPVAQQPKSVKETPVVATVTEAQQQQVQLKMGHHVAYRPAQGEEAAVGKAEIAFILAEPGVQPLYILHHPTHGMDKASLLRAEPLAGHFDRAVPASIPAEMKKQLIEAAKNMFQEGKLYFYATIDELTLLADQPLFKGDRVSYTRKPGSDAAAWNRTLLPPDVCDGVIVWEIREANVTQCFVVLNAVGGHTAEEFVLCPAIQEHFDRIYANTPNATPAFRQNVQNAIRQQLGRGHFIFSAQSELALLATQTQAMTAAQVQAAMTAEQRQHTQEYRPPVLTQEQQIAQGKVFVQEAQAGKIPDVFFDLVRIVAKQFATPADFENATNGFAAQVGKQTMIGDTPNALVNWIYFHFAATPEMVALNPQFEAMRASKSDMDNIINPCLKGMFNNNISKTVFWKMAKERMAALDAVIG